MSDKKQNNLSRTLRVVVLTAVTMVVEVIFGLTTKSMALLAYGIHMDSLV
jgi:Co/Zn/Cd efflux system component